MQIREYTPTSHKVKALVYGASGSGKTSFAGTARDALFLSAEGGLLSLADKRVSYVDIHSIRDLEEALAFLQKNPGKYKTVIIDSITEINDIIMSEIERRTGRKMQIQDYGELAQKMKSILRRFRDLDLHVLFLGLEKSLDDDGKLLKIVPEVAGKAATGIAQFMDIVGYISVDKTGERSILTATNPLYLTKDRSRMLADAPLDFENWIERVQAIKTGEQKVVYSDIALPEQIGRISELWREYAEIKNINPSRIPGIIKATLERDFKQSTLKQLSPVEAEKHINGLSEVVGKLKADLMREEEIKDAVPEIEYEANGKSPQELAAELAEADAEQIPTAPAAPEPTAKEKIDADIKRVIATKAERKLAKEKGMEATAPETDVEAPAESDATDEQIPQDPADFDQSVHDQTD